MCVQYEVHGLTTDGQQCHGWDLWCKSMANEHTRIQENQDTVQWKGAALASFSLVAIMLVVLVVLLRSVLQRTTTVCLSEVHARPAKLHNFFLPRQDTT